MENLDEILGAFEKALELERELGTRTVECDRALLAPVKAAEAARPSPPVAEPKPSAPPASAAGCQPVAAPRPPAPSGTAVAEGNVAVREPDFLFVVDQMPQGEAAAMLRKMIAAMGCTGEDAKVALASDPRPPRSKVRIVLGKLAFKAFAPGQKAAVGLWTDVAGVPTVVTYSPARIITYFGNDAAGLDKAKRQIWADLKSALARAGRALPETRARRGA